MEVTQFPSRRLISSRCPAILRLRQRIVNCGDTEWDSTMLGFQVIQNTQVRRRAASLVLIGTFPLAAGCGKTSARDPAAGGAPQAMPPQVKVAQEASITQTT